MPRRTKRTKPQPMKMIATRHNFVGDYHDFERFIADVYAEHGTAGNVISGAGPTLVRAMARKPLDPHPGPYTLRNRYGSFTLADDATAELGVLTFWQE